MPKFVRTIQPGMSVCITCGSRGIDNIVAITRSVADFCKERGVVAKKQQPLKF